MPGRAPSLTRRLIAVVVLSQLLLAGGLLSVGAWFIRHELLDAFDTALRGRALELAALVEYRDNGRGLQFDAALAPPSADRDRPYRFEIDAADLAPGGGTLLLGRSPQPLPASVLRRGASGYVHFREDGVPYRGLALLDTPVLDPEVNVAKHPYRLDIYFATPSAELENHVDAVIATIAGASLLLLLLSAVLAAWAIRRGLQPLRRLAAEAAAISVRNWRFSPPATVAATAELAPLAQALERMLSGLQAAFHRQHEFLADAAHELKTPVAILKSALQLSLRHERSAAAYRADIARSLEDVERLEALLARMLQLARAEAPRDGVPPARPVVTVAPTCEAAAEQLAPLAAAHSIRLELNTDAAATAADPDDLELVWRNLLENAIRHSPAGAAVRLRCRAAAGAAEVVVEDDGCGIAPAALPHIFERFHRGDPSRARATGGSGLGLAICKAVVAAYGGTIAVASTPGHGTRVTVRLPAAAGGAQPSAPAADVAPVATAPGAVGA